MVKLAGDKAVVLGLIGAMDRWIYTSMEGKAHLRHWVAIWTANPIASPAVWNCPRLSGTGLLQKDEDSELVSRYVTSGWAVWGCA